MKVPSTTTLSFPTLSPLLTAGKNIVGYFLDSPRKMKGHWTTYDGWTTDLDCCRACCVIVIVAIVAYSVDTDTENDSSSSKLDNSSAQNILLFLPALLYPLPGKYCVLNFGRTNLLLEMQEINFLCALTPAE
jgi:hypothetical protein